MSTNGPSLKDEKVEISENDGNTPTKEPVKRARSASGPILRLLEHRRRSMEDIATDRVGLVSPRAFRESPRKVAINEDDFIQTAHEQPKTKPGIKL